MLVGWLVVNWIVDASISAKTSIVIGGHQVFAVIIPPCLLARRESWLVGVGVFVVFVECL